jgi:radical SAM protein with 4Fe4S-binding SPASM domain
MNFSTEIVHGHYLVSCFENGAVSLFSPAEFLAFKSIIDTPDGERKEVLRKLIADFGCDDKKIDRFSDIFLRKLEQQGWFRKYFLEVEQEKLQMVYFSITTKCNLSCLYCYIGDERRKPDQFMTYENAITILKKIKAFNPNACIAVTGGEPFVHPDIFRILDFILAIDLKFKLGTNAILIDESCAKRLKVYPNLLFIQASLDGITPEVHAITRGDSYHDTLKGINNIIANKLPFALAPTLHEGNIHEMYDIARFAKSNGGIFSPNHLRKFPHAPYAKDIHLKSETLRKGIIETFSRIEKEFGTTLNSIKSDDHGAGVLQNHRCRYVCGNAYSTVDIDWNGDVYPCHLLREKELMLGNILEEEFPILFERGKVSKTRVSSYEIPKCKTCPFVATCGGGCRSSAYFNHGTFAAEEEYCDILYKFEIDKLFQNKGISFHV